MSSLINFKEVSRVEKLYNDRIQRKKLESKDI